MAPEQGELGKQEVESRIFEESPYGYIGTVFGQKVILLTNLICSC